MRMLFSSPRLENVEAVQQLFIDAGIENKITGGRSYKSISRREFSYNEKGGVQSVPQPQLWVIRADDYRKAREILLEQGLLADKQESSYLPKRYQRADKALKPANKLNKTRMVLLAAVMGLLIIQALRLLSQSH